MKVKNKMPNIKENPIWQVVDSTKLNEYIACPRRYFFRYILGWSEIEPSIHLEFGIAWHLAMEHLLLHDYSPQACKQAYILFLDHYRQFWSEAYDEGNAPKSPANVARGLFQYIEVYADDKQEFQVLETEIAGVVLLQEGRSIHFRMDSICSGERGYFSLEHKTGKNSRTWIDQWRQSIQIGTYLHVLNCMYDDKDVQGVRINAFFPSNPPRVKKDGELYAGARDNEFCRIPLHRSLKQMDDWFCTVDSYMKDLHDDTEKMLSTKASDSTMKAFRKCPVNCTQYFGCAFADLCGAWPNPLAEAYDIVQPGFREKHWDPRPKELGGQGLGAKKIINL